MITFSMGEQLSMLPPFITVQYAVGLHQLLGHLFPSVELQRGSYSSLTPTCIFIKVHFIMSKSHSSVRQSGSTNATGYYYHYIFAPTLISSLQIITFSNIQNAAAHLTVYHQQKDT